MYPGDANEIGRNRPAVVMTGSGQTLTWGELDEHSNRLAQHWHSAGLRVGDHVAMLVENRPEFSEIFWAAQRSGLYCTPINTHLTAPEVAYILGNCEAKAIVTSVAHVSVADAASNGLEALRSRLCLATVGLVPAARSADTQLLSFDSYESALAAASPNPLEHETAGNAMLYSSGTTGNPKGVWRPLTGRHPRELVGSAPALKALYNGGYEMRYLSPAPSYHSAPLSFMMGTHSLGGTVYMMERFDATAALRAIETYEITHSQWVPTMFSRMLNLPDDVKSAIDFTSHKFAIHGAAPCPVPLKRAMIDWWGPIIWEYYAGTEGPGSTVVSSEEWLRKPGTVGKCATGVIHILDDESHEVPRETSGTIYFESPSAGGFAYFGDATKTTDARTTEGWATMGDVGYLDADDYLFLTDRKAFMIISGGVNVYPQEAENLLLMHPSVADAAVFGVPHADLGEVPQAVVELRPGVEPSAALAAELVAYCREHLATIKCPRAVDFEAVLPRLPTGKLYKRALRDRYWPPATS